MKELSELKNNRRHYSFLDFLNEAIWLLSRVFVMYAVVIIGVCIWGLFNPQVKAFLLATQNKIFG